MRYRLAAVVMAIAIGATAYGQETYKEAWGKAYKTYRARKYKEAIGEFEAALKLATKPAERSQSQMYVCYSLYNSRQYPKCAEACRSLLEMPDATKGDRLNAQCYLGYSLYNARKYAESTQEWKKLMEQKGVSKRYQALALYYTGACENALKQYDKAMESFQKCVDLSGGPKGYGASAQISLAQLYAYRKNDLKKGVELLQAILAVPKLSGYGVSQAEYETGRLYYNKRQYAKAREHFAKACAAKAHNCNFQAWSQYFAGLSYVSEKKYDEARAAFESIPKMKGVAANIAANAKKQLAVLDKLQKKGK